MGRPAVFFDRDGTLIEDRHYLGDPDGVVLVPGAAAAVKRLNQHSVPVIVVTNQSGIARGYFTEASYRAVEARVEAALRAEGAELNGSYHCPHGPDDPEPCACRKPRPGLFQRAAREHGLDLARSHYIGDRLRDIAAGAQMGGSGYLIGAENAGSGAQLPSRVERVDRVEDAVERVLQRLGFD